MSFDFITSSYQHDINLVYKNDVLYQRNGSVWNVVPNATDLFYVAIGYNLTHNIYIKNDGTVYVLALGDTPQVTNQVMRHDNGNPFYARTNNFREVAISMESDIIMIIGVDGAIYRWVTALPQVMLYNNAKYGQGGAYTHNITNAIRLSSNDGSAMVIDEDGAAWGLGNNNAYELGTQYSTNDSDTWYKVDYFTNNSRVIQKVVFSYQTSAFLTTNYELYTCGINSSGEIGDGTTINRTSPTYITNGVSDIAATGNAGALAIIKSGDVYVNGYSECAGHTTAQGDVLTPTLLSGLSNTVNVCNFNNGFIAIDENDTIKIWGLSPYTITPESIYIPIDTPTGLSTSQQPITSTSFRLSWDSVANADNYKIYVNGVYNQTQPYGHPFGDITGLTPDTSYSLTVQAISATRPDSAISAPLIVWTKLALATNVTQTGATASSVSLSWSNSNPGADDYYVLMNGVTNKIVTSTYATITGLPSGSSNGFSIIVRDNENTTSVTSNQTSQVTMQTLCSAPGSLSSSNITQTSFTLSWGAVTGATSYQIYKDGIAYGSPITGTSLSITGLTVNTTFSMTVTAINSSGESAQSSPLNVLTLPEAPTNLVASNVTATSFDLSWGIVTNAISYQVYKDGTAYGSPVTDTSLSITGLTANSTSTMTVTAINSSGESVQSNSLDVLTLPEAPVNLVSNNITQTSFTLNWDAVTGAISYQVYKDGVAYGSPITDTSINVTGLTANTTFSMTVTAINSSGESVQSSSLNVLTLPEAPVNLVSNNITQTSFTLNWDAVTGAISYQVYKDGVAYGSPITDTSLSITNLSPNTTFSMTVSVNNSSGESSQSSHLNVLTLPDAVTNLVSSAQTASTITIDWDTPVTGADSYKVYVDGVEQTGLTITAV